MAVQAHPCVPRWIRALWALAALGLCLVACPAGVGAHPLGMASVNRYVGVAPRAVGLELDYLLDLAELPAYAEIERLDGDHDGRVTPAERDRFLDGLVPDIVAALRVTVDGRPVVLREVFRAMEAPPGQSGLSTLRVALTFRATPPTPLPPQGTLTVTVVDRFRHDRPGWREIDAVASEAARLVRSTVPREAPRAGAGLAYPVDPDDPRGERVRLPRIDTATFEFARGAVGDAAAAETAGDRLTAALNRRGGAGVEGGRLVALVRDPPRGPWAVLAALAMAFALGAAHALSPGHGKALVGAYLIGARGTLRHALALGLAVTVTHTVSVFALGLAALAVERTMGSARVLRTLELAAGAMVIAVALQLLPGRWRRMRAHEGPEAAHDPDAPHDHGDGHVHTHTLPETLSWRALVAMGVSGGIVPCPGALVLLLAAMGVRRTGFGLVLLVAFSAGLAAVLSAVGALFVLGRSRLDGVRGAGRVLRVLPVLSALVVLGLGGAIVARALLVR